MREPWIGRLNRRGQGIDNFILDMVGAVAGRDGPVVPPPAVLNLLVFRQRVRDVAEQPDIVVEHRGERPPGRFAHRPVRAREPVQRFGFGQIFAVEREPESRNRFVEQAVPGAAARHLLVVQQAFQIVGKLMVAEGADIAQPGLPAS